MDDIHKKMDILQQVLATIPLKQARSQRISQGLLYNQSVREFNVAILQMNDIQQMDEIAEDIYEKLPANRRHALLKEVYDRMCLVFGY